MTHLIVTCSDCRITPAVMGRVLAEKKIHGEFFYYAVPGGPNRLVPRERFIDNYSFVHVTLADISLMVTGGADHILLVAHGGICRWAVVNGVYGDKVSPEAERKIQLEQLEGAKKTCIGNFGRKVKDVDTFFIPPEWFSEQLPALPYGLSASMRRDMDVFLGRPAPTAL